MSKKILLFFAIVLFAFNFVACNKDNDEDKLPRIKINEPIDGDSLKPGSVLHWDVEFTAVDTLKACKIDIHWGEDHDHTKATESWSLQKTFSLEGSKNKALHEHFNIPANAKEGKYHLVVYCTDVDGNESRAFVSVILSNQAKEHFD